MSEQAVEQTINIREVKEYAQRLPDPVRSLILSSRDEMDREEFLTKLLEWRKLLRMQMEFR